MEENNVWESDQLFYLWQHTGDIHLHLSWDTIGISYAHKSLQLNEHVETW
jgi:hypothetical protein